MDIVVMIMMLLMTSFTGLLGNCVVYFVVLMHIKVNRGPIITENYVITRN